MSSFITQPFTPQSYDQILQTLISYMSAQSTVNDNNIGSVIRTFFESISLLLDNSYFQLVNVINSFYINTATGTDLDRRGTDFNIQRFLANSALVNLYFTGTIGYTIPAGTICYAPASGNTPQQSFITQVAGVVGQPISAICLTPGSAGNVAAGTIQFIQNNPSSMNITGVNNPLQSNGGFDQESDAAYRTRIIAYLTSLSQGTANAITSALLNIPNAGITEVQILQVNLSPSTLTNPYGVSTGWSLSFTAPHTNYNTDLQGTIYSPTLYTCRLGTVAPLPTNVYAGGASGVGATLTGTTVGQLVVDGISVNTNDRILVQTEAAPAHNGVYIVSATGASGAPYVLIRSSDMNTAYQFLNYGTFVSAGNTLAGLNFLQTNESFTQVGVSPANFSQVMNAVLSTVTALFPTYTYNNGASGVGATLTATSNGSVSIDGITPTVGNRVLIKDEIGSNAPYNGVYVVTAVGSPSTPYILTRATDLDTPSQFINYAVFISSGQSNINSTFIQLTNPFTTVGTSVVAFGQIGESSASGPNPNSPGCIVIFIDDGYGSLPFQSVEAALNVANGVPSNYAVYPGIVAAGVQAFVSRPEVREQQIVLTIVIDPTSTLNPAQIVQNVQLALTNYFPTIPLNGTIYKAAIIDVVMNVPGVIDVPFTSFTSPVSDVTFNESEFVRSVPGSLIISY